MSDQYLGEIRIVPFNFAPLGWALCNGQILPIAQYTALFSLLGTQFGGNGTSNFGLPNLQGCAPMDQGNGAGLTPRVMGELGGETNVTLLSTQLASHAHTAHAGVVGNAVTPDPTKTFGSGGRGKPATYGAAPPPNSALMSAQAVGLTGGNQPHNNLPPYLTLNFIIAMTGIYPARG